MSWASDKKIIEDCIKEQKENGIDEVKIYKEALDFALTQLDCNDRHYMYDPRVLFDCDEGEQLRCIKE